MKAKLILGVIFFINSLGCIFGQGRSISGIVKDISGEPMIGVSVKVKNTLNGVATDLEGRYVLKNVASDDVLIFSFIGMITQNVVVGNKRSINIVLKEQSEMLNEVMVIGYGTQKKVTVTGSVSVIDNKEIKSSPSANTIGSLTGKLPGLTIMQGSSQPGSEDFEIRLRGASTLNGQSPLVLVDGVPRDEDISMMDPNEIDNISILKDASATAVFGVRGANGVILITTKTGTQEKPKLSASAEYGRQSFTTDYHMCDSWQYATLRNEALANDGLQPYYTQRQIDLYRNGGNPLYPNVDWFKVMFKDYAPMSRYNVNLTGGTKDVKYFVNAGFLNQGGMMNTESKDKLGYDPQYKLNRYNFRANLDINATKWLKIGVKLSGYIDKVNRPYGSTTNQYAFLGGIYTMRPTVPVFADKSFGLPDGVLLSSNNSSPYGSLNYLGYQTQDKNKLNSTLTADINLNNWIKGLSTKLMASYDMQGTSTISGSKSGYNLYMFDVREEVDENNNVIDLPTFNNPAEYQRYDLAMSKAYVSQYSLNLQWIINYKRSFKKHDIGAMMVLQRDNREASSGSNIDLLPYNRLGYAGRLSYNYGNKYLAEVNVGYNGSEQFAKGKRFGFFPAGSLGWVISNEKFFQRLKWLSNLKVRGSFGKVGNDKIGSNRFLYMDNNSVGSGGKISTIGNGKQINEALIGNPDLTWETAYKQNYGVDAAFLQNQISFGFDLFSEKRDNILITRNSVPSILGNAQSSIPKANIGKVNNKGFELTMGWHKRINKDLSFSSKISLNYAKNKIVYNDELYRGDDYVCPYRAKGYSMGQNFGYLIDWNSLGHGYFTSEEEIANYYKYDGTQPRVGDFVYKDLNNDGTISEKDQVAIGKPTLPEMNYSLNLNINFKGIDLSMLFYAIGDSYFNYSNSNYGILENESIYQDHHLHAWTLDRFENGEKITYPALSTLKSSSMTGNDFFISNRKFIRLKNLEVGYTIPNKISKHIGINKCRLYINGSNLLTWTNIPFSLVDPEQKGTSSVLPIQRVINIGANIAF